MGLKELFAVAAIVLLIVGYLPYLRDTITGKAKPHIFSWVLWGVAALVIFFIRADNMAGPGAWTNLFAALVCFLVVVFGLKNGKKYIAKIDYLFLAISLLALMFWLIADQPLTAVLLILLVDGAAFAPTVRKSWIDPTSETLFMWFLGAIRHGVGLLAINVYSVITVLEPLLWAIANALFIIMILIRRRQLRFSTS